MNTVQTDKMENQYKTPCENCTIVLSEDVSIMCCKKGDEEMTICADCWYDCEESWRKDGWKCDEDEVCNMCDEKAEHSLYHGEYNYCDKHYEGHIVGECAGCNTEIHDSWDWCAMKCADFCRRCAKDHEECKECFPEDEEEVCYKCKDTLCEVVGVVFPKKDDVYETFCNPCWFNKKTQWKSEGWVNEDEEEVKDEQ